MSTPPPPDSAEMRLLRLAAVLALTASVALLVVVSQARRFDHDEFELAHSAWYIASGHVPYRDFFQNHHPLAYYLAAPLVSPNGWPTDLLDMRLALLPLAVFLAACAGALAATLGGSRRTAWISVLLLLTMTRFVRAATELRPDVPYACCAAAGMLCFFKAASGGGRRWLAASGSVLAVGLMFHQKAVLPLAVLTVAAAGIWAHDRWASAARLLLPSVVATAGYAAWCAWNGYLGDYWGMAWRFPALAGGHTAQHPFVQFGKVLGENPGFWLSAAIGAVVWLRHPQEPPARRWFAAVTLLLLGVLLATGNPVGHYLLPVFPLAAVLGAFVIERWTAGGPRQTLRVGGTLLVVGAVPLVVLLLWTQPQHPAQIEMVAFARALVPAGAAVHDGDIQFNVFRKDAHHLWFLVGRARETAAYNQVAGPGRAPYDECSAIRRSRPQLISGVRVSPANCGIGGGYRQVRPGLFVRMPSSEPPAGATGSRTVPPSVPAAAASSVGPEATHPSEARPLEAARLMSRALGVIRDLRLARGIPIDPALDPNRTGIVGDEFTPLTTSLGDVEAKRTAANPEFAAAVTRYFQDAGLKRGDVVAIGASGSFPAFILATFSAARALELEPLAIYSVGASMYGANLPGFTFVDMLAGLREAGVLPYRFIAVAPGGLRDTGRGVLFDEEGATLVDEARRTGLSMLGGGTLAENIQERLRVFDAAAGGRPIRCFVNIGGASANFGDTAASLELPPGLVRRVAKLPAEPTRGLVFEFVSRGVPVIHLLFVKGLAKANGLPYDPVPFPASVGSGPKHSVGG